MSVIVVVSDGKRCCMAADSLATNNGAKAALAEPKILRLGDALFGTSGSQCINEFLRKGSDSPWTLETAAEIARTLVDPLRSWLKEREHLIAQPDGTKELPGHVLVAHRGDWALIDGGGNVMRFNSPWWAIGHGCAEARGALHAIGQLHPFDRQSNVEESARIAVQAAIDLDDSCGPPITVEWTEPIPADR